MRLRYLTLCVVVLLACGAQAKVRARKTVRLNQNFVLRVGQEVSVAGQNLNVKLVSVPEDSRCPKGVNCIWAGNARVMLQVSPAKGRPAKLELNTNAREAADGAGGGFGQYLFKLVEVAPYPVEGQTIGASSYTVTLVVSKK
ncbi:MAG TPA: hypothetical protein VEZ40_10340 [Pyrinomonadaceae bacterium]|nr:hypothetical protein [Pyrinomonadaceae bacterium]